MANVSIHAPARGATLYFSFLDRLCAVSIHAPARGATLPFRLEKCMKPCFNPRPRTGGDLLKKICRFRGLVSIHAPARGATSYPAPLSQPLSFNPRPRTGGDKGPQDKGLGSLFQSTPPHGGRHTTYEVCGSATGFQSTPPHGGRPQLTGKFT